jgi:hypothetical protein
MRRAEKRYDVLKPRGWSRKLGNRLHGSTVSSPLTRRMSKMAYLGPGPE